MKEIWKTIEEFDDYQVSNYGNVKSLKFDKEKTLKPCIGTDGYYRVCLHKNKRNVTKKIHQLVAIAFLNHKPCGFKFVVNHKDFNRLNNHVDNLEIVTNRENSNKKHIPSTSQYVGVSWENFSSKWISKIAIKGKFIFLGRFTNEYDAHIAYQNKLKEITINNY